MSSGHARTALPSAPASADWAGNRYSTSPARWVSIAYHQSVVNEPVGVSFIGQARQLLGMADIEPGSHQRLSELAHQPRSNRIFPRLFHLVILGPCLLPALRRSCRKRQYSVFNRLAGTDQHGWLIVLQKLFMLVVTDNDHNVGMRIRQRRLATIYPRLTPTNFVVHDIRQQLPDNRGVCLLKQRVITERRTTSIAIRLTRDITLGVFQIIGGRATKDRSMGLCGSQYDFCRRNSPLEFTPVDIVTRQGIVDQRGCLIPIIGAMRMRLHNERRPGIELFVLLVPPCKF